MSVVAIPSRVGRALSQGKCSVKYGTNLHADLTVVGISFHIIIDIIIIIVVFLLLLLLVIMILLVVLLLVIIIVIVIVTIIRYAHGITVGWINT